MNPYIEIIFRCIIVYLFIVIAIRLFGKKEIAQLSVVDLVFILLISNSVQNAMVGPDSSLIGGLIAAGSLFIVNLILKYVSYKSKKINKLIEGEPVILIYNGILNEENIKKERITMEEIETVVREHGVKSISEVNLAMLEVDGNISIVSDSYSKRTVRRRKAHKVIQKMDG